MTNKRRTLALDSTYNGTKPRLYQGTSVTEPAQRVVVVVIILELKQEIKLFNVAFTMNTANESVRQSKKGTNVGVTCSLDLEFRALEIDLPPCFLVFLLLELGLSPTPFSLSSSSAATSGAPSSSFFCSFFVLRFSLPISCSARPYPSFPARGYLLWFPVRVLPETQTRWDMNNLGWLGSSACTSES